MAHWLACSSPRWRRDDRDTGSEHLGIVPEDGEPPATISNGPPNAIPQIRIRDTLAHLNGVPLSIACVPWPLMSECSYSEPVVKSPIMRGAKLAFSRSSMKCIEKRRHAKDSIRTNLKARACSWV